MVIDRSGQWWTGDSASDLGEYAAAFSAGAYPVRTVVHATCASCGGTEFGLALDDDEGCAVRSCTTCGRGQAMLDSADHLQEAELEQAECPCGGATFSTAVGFAFHGDGDDVRWVYVVLRCVDDGVLGCYADWKIDYTPSAALVDAV